MIQGLKLPTQKKTPGQADNYGTWSETRSSEDWNKLYAQLEPTINTAMKNFGGSDPALKVRAMILAKQAVESYDPDNLKGASLPTHVYHTLKRLNRFREERQAPVYYPESVRDDRRAVYRYQQAFRETHQRDPSREEVMDDLGISKKRLLKATGLAQDVPETGMLSETGHMAPIKVEPLERRRRMRTDYVYQDQDQIGKQIMEWTMGYGGVNKLPKAEIATRLNISAPAVSKRIGKILDNIDKPEEYDQSTTDMRPGTDLAPAGSDLPDDLLPQF